MVGIGVRRLDIAVTVAPLLEATLAARTFAEREAALVEAFQAVGLRHNAGGLTQPVPTEVSPFQGRPFRVIGSGRFVDACLHGVKDPWLLALPLVGAIDQFADSTDVLQHDVSRRLASTYE